ncbi:MAG: phospholipase A2, partial [Gemmatimonadales bacterium]
GTRTFYREGCKKPVPKLNFTPNENGCGPQNGFNPVPQTPLNMASFTSACNEHDRGYATCNRPKATTDQRFLNDMKLICLREYPVTGMYSAMSLTQCITNADVYYKAVSTLGDDPYKEGQAESCDCCEECPGDQQKCGTECCRKGFVCGTKGLCCEDCQPNWKKCPMDEGRCGWGCCMPDLSLCCPGMQAGKIRCCSPKGKCYKGGCG